MIQVAVASREMTVPSPTGSSLGEAPDHDPGTTSGSDSDSDENREHRESDGVDKGRYAKQMLNFLCSLKSNKMYNESSMIDISV